MVDLSDSLEGEWIGFEQFLEMLTHSIVLCCLVRVMGKVRRVVGRLFRCWTGRGREG